MTWHSVRYEVSASMRGSGNDDADVDARIPNPRTPEPAGGDLCQQAPPTVPTSKTNVWLGAPVRS